MYSKVGGNFAPGATVERGAAMMGGEAAAAGLPLPTLSSESPALQRARRRQKVEKLRTLRSARARAPRLSFFLLKCGSGANGASSLSPHFLNGEQSFGSALRGFDPEEGEHPVASCAGKLGQQQVILIARHLSKHLVSTDLHLHRIYF